MERGVELFQEFIAAADFVLRFAQQRNDFDFHSVRKPVAQRVHGFVLASLV
jgi:hypothetical protein